METNLILQAEHLHTLFSQFEGLLRQINGGNHGTCSGEINRIRPDSTPHLQNLHSSPTLKLSKAWDVRFDKIFPLLHFIEIFFRADWKCGVPNIARTGVPIGL